MVTSLLVSRTTNTHRKAKKIARSRNLARGKIFRMKYGVPMGRNLPEISSACSTWLRDFLVCLKFNGVSNNEGLLGNFRLIVALSV